MFPSTKKLFRVIGQYLCYAVIMAMLTGIYITNLQMNELLTLRIDALEQGFIDLGEKQSLALAEKGLEIAEAQKSALEELIISGTMQTGRRLSGVDSRIQRIDALYSELLAVQKKRTLDSLYSQEEMAGKVLEATALFNMGKYAGANVLYSTIAREQPENADARFYQFCSLFLANKLDRGNYRLIKDAFVLLEKNGYYRPEMGEILEYIRLEETGIFDGGRP